MAASSSQTSRSAQQSAALNYRELKVSFKQILGKSRSQRPAAITDFFDDFLCSEAHLTAEHKVQLLSGHDRAGRNLLQYVCRNQPDEVEAILAAINRINDFEIQSQIFTHRSRTDKTALDYARQYNPDIAAVIEKAGIIAQLNLYIKRTLSGSTYSSREEAFDQFMQLFLASETLLTVEDISKLLGPDGRYNGFIVHYASSRKPDALTRLLPAINRLGNGQKAGMLKKLSYSRSNALMQACHFRMGSVMLLLPLINNLDYDSKATILTQVDEDGWNALMYASLHQPKIVAFLMPAIDDLDYDDKIEILTQTDEQGYHALMLACRFGSPAVAPLLESINQIEDLEVRAQILLHRSIDGNDALALARHYLTYAPEIVQLVEQVSAAVQLHKQLKDLFRMPLDEKAAALSQFITLFLELEPRLTPADKIKLLRQSNNIDWSLLHYICKYQPDALPLLMPTLHNLDADKKAEVLTKIDVDCWNALMIACRHHPDAIPHLITLINELDDDNKITALTQTTNSGWNALILACHYCPEALADLILAFNTLSAEVKASVYRQTTDFGFNALFFACRYHPEVVETLIGAINQLSLEVQKQIYTQRNDYHDDALAIAHQYNPAIAPLIEQAMAITQLSLQLNELFRVSSTEKTGVITRFINNFRELAPVLSKADIATLLQQSNNNNWNLLHYLCKYQPEAVETVIGAINQIEDLEVRAHIFAGRNNDGDDALAIARRDNPAIAPLIESALAHIEHQRQVQDDIDISLINQRIHDLTGIDADSIERNPDHPNLLTIVLTINRETLFDTVKRLNPLGFGASISIARDDEENNCRITISQYPSDGLFATRPASGPRPEDEQLDNNAPPPELTKTAMLTFFDHSEPDKLPGPKDCPEQEQTPASPPRASSSSAR